MSVAPVGGDVRGFYAALGVQLPDWGGPELAVGCFANPDGHANGDRNASCSVNVESGLWNCHGCGVGGGPYDAADALGRTPREAIDLLVSFGLAQRRPANERPAGARSPVTRRPVAGVASVRARGELAVGAGELERWRSGLREVWPPRVLRAEQRKLWSLATLCELGCGWDRGRVMIPVRDGAGRLCGVLRYAPRHDHAPKMLAVAGTRLELVPHPATIATEWVVVVEGPPDMISARSRGLPAVAVPGDHAWEPEWACLFSGRRVSVVMDCDAAGREAAGRIAGDLAQTARSVVVVELAPERTDGYDLTDWLSERANLPVREIAAALGWAAGQPSV